MPVGRFYFYKLLLIKGSGYWLCVLVVVVINRSSLEGFIAVKSNFMLYLFLFYYVVIKATNYVQFRHSSVNQVNIVLYIKTKQSIVTCLFFKSVLVNLCSYVL